MQPLQNVRNDHPFWMEDHPQVYHSLVDDQYLKADLSMLEAYLSMGEPGVPAFWSVMIHGCMATICRKCLKIPMHMTCWFTYDSIQETISKWSNTGPTINWNMWEWCKNQHRYFCRCFFNSHPKALVQKHVVHISKINLLNKIHSSFPAIGFSLSAAG